MRGHKIHIYVIFACSDNVFPGNVAALLLNEDKADIIGKEHMQELKTYFTASSVLLWYDEGWFYAYPWDIISLVPRRSYDWPLSVKQPWIWLNEWMRWRAGWIERQMILTATMHLDIKIWRYTLNKYLYMHLIDFIWWTRPNIDNVLIHVTSVAYNYRFFCANLAWWRTEKNVSVSYKRKKLSDKMPKYHMNY